MVDIIDIKQVFSGRRYEVFNLTAQLDGVAQETDAIKVDISTLTDAVGNPCTYTAVDRIEYSVFGMNYAVLEWEHTADDEIAVLSGQGVMDWSQLGGSVDPRSAGGTGDIVLTTDGAADGAGYSITIYVRPKA